MDESESVAVSAPVHQQEQEQEQDIFSIRHLDWSVKAPSKAKKHTRTITKVAVNNNVFVLGTSDGVILRWNIEAGGDAEEIELSKKVEDNIHDIFIDCTAHHVIVSLKNGDAYYLHSRSSKARKLSKLNGSVECVAFDRTRATEASTKSLLVGTSTGRVYELVIESSGKERVCQLVHQLENPHPIASIYFENYAIHSTAQPPGSTGAQEDEGGNRIFVILSTSSPTRLYHFIGGPSFQQLFQDYKTTGSSSFTELPGTIDCASLHCYSKRHPELVQAYALVTQMGLYHGSILLSTSAPQTSADNVLMEAGLMPYIPPQGVSSRMLPTSVVVTEFHFLLLYPHAMVCLSRITGEVQQEDNLLLVLSSGVGLGEDSGEPVSLIKDPVKNALWLVTTTSIFQITTKSENRNVWSMYLAKAVQGGDPRLFDTAHQFCRKEEQRRSVHRAQAAYYLSKGNPERAATHFAVTGIPFEEVVLLLLSSKGTASAPVMPHLSIDQSPSSFSLLLDIGEIEVSDSTAVSLRVYLQEKLRMLPAGSKSQRTMIATWLCEVYLHTLAVDRDREGGVAGESKTGRMFKDFLRNNRGTLDTATTISLLVSRGRDFRPLLLFYCRIVGDYERVLSHYVSEGLYADAVSVLQDSPIEKVEGLLYKKAPVLMEHHPELTARLLLSKPYLRPTSLLPALFRYSEVLDRQYARLESRRKAMSHLDQKSFVSPLGEPRTSNEEPIMQVADAEEEIVLLDEDSDGNKKNFAIWYLEETLKAAAADGGIYIEPPVYHALIWFLAKYDDDSEEGLLNVICPLVDGTYGDEGVIMDKDGMDLALALRVCRRYSRTRACVYLYVLLGAMEKAVALALDVDVDLAKSIAARPVEYGIAKKLWLEIVQHIIAVCPDNDMGRVLGVLKESGGVLRIEDILEHLPDFTEIDQFKDEIYGTLEDYAGRVEAMREEMEELSSAAEMIETELTSVTTRGYGVRAGQVCEICEDPILGRQRQFYLFPCGHGFHEDCLLKKSPEYLDSDTDVKLALSLEEQIKGVAARAKDNDKRSLAQLEQLQAELDGLIAADCPLCGDSMIRSVGRSLISSGDALEAKSWEL
mmetsp:Transcript_13019/g.19636  ORF Transcript_13019/g.19636 Transcript_13019/m.19636 type:complete len:1090 (-) Transcript_13019:185-3454(-)